MDKKSLRDKDIDYGRTLERAAITSRIKKAYVDSEAFEGGDLASHDILDIVLIAVARKGD